MPKKKKQASKLKLTEANYYTRENMFITNSKIGDYLKDKAWFYKKHVLGIIEQGKSEALVIGSAVDCILTEGWDAFKGRYKPVARRNLKEPPVGYTELSETQYDQIVAMCERVMQQRAFKELAGFQTQKILQYDMPLGMFYGIAGKPDWFIVDGKRAIIRDLKTSATIDPNKYYYHSLRYGYFRQQAMYQILLEKNYGIKQFVSEHLTVEKDPDGVFNCQTFRLDQEIIEKEKQFIMDVLWELSNEKEFLSNNVSFETPCLLGHPVTLSTTQQGEFVEV